MSTLFQITIVWFGKTHDTKEFLNDWMSNLFEADGSDIHQNIKTNFKMKHDMIEKVMLITNKILYDRKGHINHQRPTKLQSVFALSLKYIQWVENYKCFMLCGNEKFHTVYMFMPPIQMNNLWKKYKVSFRIFCFCYNDAYNTLYI